MACQQGTDAAAAADTPGAAAATGIAADLDAGAARAAAARRGAAETDPILIDTARDLWCDAERSSRYHGSRAAFFDRLHRAAMFVVFLAGSAAAASATSTLIDWPYLTVVLALIPAVVSAAELAFDITGHARRHAALRSRFMVLAGSIDVAETDPAKLAEWRRDLFRIYADEPATVYFAVNAAAHNAVAQVLGVDPQQMQRIGFWRGLFGHLFTFRATDFPRLDQPA